jgi:hypothetical protein
MYLPSTQAAMYPEPPKRQPTTMPVDRPMPESRPTSDPDLKKIFKYNNGIEDVYADPFEIEWKIQDATKMIPDIATIESRLWILNDGDKVKEDPPAEDIALFNDAWHAYVPIIAKAFDLKMLDKKTGEGLTADKMIDIYTDYLIWRENLKKNIE